MLRVPQIRFKGFHQSWRTASLSTVAEIIMGQSPKSCNYTNNPKDHILVQGNADMRNNYVVPRVWTTEITKTANKGDLVMSVRAPVGDIGKTNYDIVIGRGVAAIRGNEFIFQLLVKKNIDGYWINISSGSTFDSITSKDLATTPINFSSQSEEQEKIGNFFQKIDELIELKQKAYDKLLTLKKAFLSKMFPQHGANVPQIRFKGFSQEWANMRLGDVAESQSSNVSDNKITNNFGKYPIYGASGLLKYVDFYHMNISYISIVKDGAGVGRLNLCPAHSSILGTMQYIYTKIVDIKFLYYMLQTIDLSNYSSGSTIPHIYFKDYKQHEIFVPQSEEQEKIGNFFQKIDALIDLRKTELTKLKNIKKACLNKMFV